MNTRLNEIIQYKTGGKKTEFGALFGWSPQYVTKLLKGENFGIQPIVSILKAFPDINARWFLLGEGRMLSGEHYPDVRSLVEINASRILDLEKYMPVMTPSEIREYELMALGKRQEGFCPDTVNRWKALLADRESKLTDRFSNAQLKSDNLCKQKKAK